MALTYECPHGFEIEQWSEESLKASDVKKDDIELWLIKSPVDFDISHLSGHKMKTKFSIHSKENDKIKYVVKSNTNTSELNSYQCLFPHDTKETFTLGPSLQGQMDITKVHKIPTSANVQIPSKVQPHFPTGLKKRYVPFGSSSPKQCSRKRKIVKTDTEKSECEMEESFERERESESAKRKKKKKHKKLKRQSTSSDILEENIDSSMVSTQDVETPVGKKRKHKKKKKEEVEEEEGAEDDSIPLVDDSQIPSQLIIKDYCPAGDGEQAFEKVSKHHKKKKRKHQESSTDPEIHPWLSPTIDPADDTTLTPLPKRRKKGKENKEMRQNLPEVIEIDD